MAGTCGICDRTITPDADWYTFHTRRDRFLRWLRRNINSTLWR